MSEPNASQLFESALYPRRYVATNVNYRGRKLCQSRLHLGEVVSRRIGRHNPSVRKPSISRVLSLRLNDRFEEVDDGRFGVILVFETITICW